MVRFLLSGFLIILILPAFAQSESRSVYQTKVVKMNNKKVIGTLYSLNDSYIVIKPRSAKLMNDTIPVYSIRLVSILNKNNSGTGALIGGGLVVVGTTILAVTEPVDILQAAEIVAGAVLLIPALGIGAAIGSAISKTYWIKGNYEKYSLYKSQLLKYSVLKEKYSMRNSCSQNGELSDTLKRL